MLVDLLSYTGSKGGIETYARELYAEVGAAPAEFTFVGLASREAMTIDLSWFPGQIIDSKMSGENRFHWAWGELISVARWARRLGADLIHCLATLGPMHSRMPTIITMHDMLYFSHPEYMSTPFFTEPVKLMEKLAARNASWVLTDSESSAREIHKYLRYPTERTQVVHLAGSSTQEARLAQSRRSDLILAVGNRRPHKNFDGLVRAMALVDEAVRPTLTITGSRGDDPLRPIVADLRLEEWVDLREWVSPRELDQLFSSATALAVPSFAEGFGLPILEAMGTGLPVIVSDLPVLREVAGNAAVYFDPDAPPSIANAISRLVTEPELLQRMSRDGLRRQRSSLGLGSPQRH